MILNIHLAKAQQLNTTTFKLLTCQLNIKTAVGYIVRSINGMTPNLRRAYVKNSSGRRITRDSNRVTCYEVLRVVPRIGCFPVYGSTVFVDI